MNARSRGGHIGPPRFGVAVRALVWLAQTGGVIPSASIACQVRSHATFLRRVMTPLVQAGIVEAREGHDGGYLMGRPPESITLAEIYLAIRADGVAPSECAETDDACGEAGQRVDMALDEIMVAAEEQVIAALKRHTVADLLRRVEALDRDP